MLFKLARPEGQPSPGSLFRNTESEAQPRPSDSKSTYLAPEVVGVGYIYGMG